ncbi:MAG: hypothetical protein KDD94_03460 [Calditrichaeota bacterium]|nr:hypothetical protein [Calditrichota bacterium]
MIQIISNPYYAIIAIIIVSFLIYLITEMLSLSDRAFKYSDYFIIIVGSIGVLGIISENGKKLSQTELIYVKNDIILLKTQLKNRLSSSEACFSYQKTDYNSSDFDIRQNDQDTVCEWAKNLLKVLDSNDTIPKINKPNLKTTFVSDFVESIINSFAHLNKLYSEKALFEKELSNDDVKKFSRTTGLLLIMLALSFKLAITTHQIVRMK